MNDLFQDNQPEKVISKRTSKLPDLPLGEILVCEKLITTEQLDEALKQQKKELSYPLGKILVDMHFINPADLNKAIDILGESGRIGDYLIEKGLIAKKQLNEALEHQKKEGKLLGQILLELGYIGQEKLVQALIDKTNKPKLGEWLVSKNLLSPANLKIALRFQSRGRRIGEILVELGYISRDKLDEVIEVHKKRESLEAVLLSEGFITNEKLANIMHDPRYMASDLTEALLAENLVDEIHVAQAHAIRYELPCLRFDKTIYSDEEKQKLSSFMSATYSRKHYTVPVSADDASLMLAVTTPKGLEHIWFINQVHKDHKISMCFITPRDFERIYGQLYGKETHLAAKQATTMELIFEHASEKRLRQLENIKQTEAVRLVHLIIEKGLAINASDIHIESDAWGTQVRYRIDGMLRHLEDPELITVISQHALSVTSRLKVMAGMDLAERRSPQDGAFRMTCRNRENSESYPIDFRVSTVKGYGIAENIAIRILDPRKGEKTLDELNYAQGDLRTIKKILNSPSGLFLVTGPTGCGKTTTLYSGLRYLNHSRIKIMTTENPVEYIVPGITQVNTNNKIGLTHAKTLRSFLRQDPDVILVGEIRDEETAEVGIKAAETGHLVLSSLHSPDPISAILRLIDLGINRESLASTLLGIISQKLLPVNCPNCVTEYFPNESEWSLFFDEYPLGRHFYASKGCMHCDYLGFKGRRPVYEFLVIDKNIQTLLRAGSDMMQIRDEALKNGMRSMVEHAVSQETEFTLKQIYEMVPYNIVEEFKINPIINSRTYK